MVKFTKEQSKRFDKLYKDAISWDVGEMCHGIFQEFGGDLKKLNTIVEGGNLVFFIPDKNYPAYWTHGWDYHIEPAIKDEVKKLVMFLMENRIEDITFKRVRRPCDAEYSEVPDL